MVLIKRIWKISNAKNTKSPYGFAPNLNYSFLKRDAKNRRFYRTIRSLRADNIFFSDTAWSLKLDKFNQNGV